MSTRASIVYHEASGVHIFQELLENSVCLEISREGINLLVELMPVEEWQALGLQPEVAQRSVEHHPQYNGVDICKSCGSWVRRQEGKKK